MDDFLGSECSAARHLRFESLSSEVGQLLISHGASLFDCGDPLSKKIHRESSELVRIRHPIPLPSQVFKPC